jgi:1-acyl-sn-glycerol-3-phosphate acyltransferase
LLWDACLDLVGNRLPNVFVRRGSGDGAREIDATRRLALGLGEREGVLIYPEGTRFTPAKRERALARLAESRNPERLAQARAMQHVLPPHLGGPLALIETGGRADALFFSHTGLEGTASIRDVWNGALLGRRIRVRLWRVPRADVPTGRNERIAWLDREWAKVDEHVGRTLAAG